MLPETVEARKILASGGISARVMSFHTVKPLDEACLADALGRFRIVATVEEHSLIGGFGSAVAEWAVEARLDTRKLLRIGTPDKFFKESGEQEHARKQLGISAHRIAERIAGMLSSDR
jgi:transketolase